MGQQSTSHTLSPSEAIKIQDIEKLNEELLVVIIHFLPEKTLIQFEKTCKRNYELCKKYNEDIWKWRCSRKVGDDNEMMSARPSSVTWKEYFYAIELLRLQAKNCHNSSILNQNFLCNKISSANTSPQDFCFVGGDVVMKAGRVYRWQFKLHQVPKGLTTGINACMVIFGVRNNTAKQSLWRYIYDGQEKIEPIGWLPISQIKQHQDKSSPYREDQRSHAIQLSHGHALSFVSTHPLNDGDAIAVELDMTNATQQACKRIQELAPLYPNLFEPDAADLPASVKSERDKLGCTIRFFKNGKDLGLAYCALPYHELRLFARVVGGYTLSVLPFFQSSANQDK